MSLASGSTVYALASGIKCLMSGTGIFSTSSGIAKIEIFGQIDIERMPLNPLSAVITIENTNLNYNSASHGSAQGVDTIYSFNIVFCLGAYNRRVGTKQVLNVIYQLKNVLSGHHTQDFDFANNWNYSIEVKGSDYFFNEAQIEEQKAIDSGMFFGMLKIDCFIMELLGV